jgi:chloramphenicol 3-O phosphotransferase
MGQGNVVLLNSTSSAGKSTIARALQEIMETPYLHMGIDHFLSSVPPTDSLVTEVDGQVTTDFFQVVYQGRTTESIAAVQRGSDRAGSNCWRGCIAASPPRGSTSSSTMLSTIVACSWPRWRRCAMRRCCSSACGCRWRSLCGGSGSAVIVGPGGAAAFADLVHAHGGYDLDLDTATASPMECALRIKQELQDGHPRRAFRELTAAFAG